MPVFVDVPAFVTVSENADVSSEVVTLSATDADLSDQLVFELTGLYPALQFFAVDRTSGVVTVAASIREDPLKLFAYTVRTLASHHY